MARILVVEDSPANLDLVPRPCSRLKQDRPIEPQVLLDAISECL
jgi:hypothetical protein